MATKEKDTNKELEVEEIVSKSEQFIENNSKKIIYGIIAVALVVGAVLGIKHGYLVPQEKKAAAAMFKGEQYFARDSFALALNGNGADYEGFEAIIDQYGSTDAGNLAKAYAGICYDKLSEHIGLLPLVMVSPADADLIRGGSDERRRFLDLIISQQDKPYLHALIQYNKALLQRNTLLKDQSMDASLYEVLEMQLGMYGQIVYEKRKKLVEDFTPIFNEYYQTICGSAEEVGLHYISQLEETELAGKLAMSRERDRILGYTSSGIHKDELEMTLGGYLIRRVGSQGQNKTYLIALKLAQFAFLNKRGQTTPILLLDDIFDKLDASRVEQIIKLVSENGFGQIFITDTNRKYLDEILLAMNHDYALFRVERGEVQPMEE